MGHSWGGVDLSSRTAFIISNNFMIRELHSLHSSGVISSTESGIVQSNSLIIFTTFFQRFRVILHYSVNIHGRVWTIRRTDRGFIIFRG